MTKMQTKHMWYNQPAISFLLEYKCATHDHQATKGICPTTTTVPLTPPRQALLICCLAFSRTFRCNQLQLWRRVCTPHGGQRVAPVQKWWSPKIPQNVLVVEHNYYPWRVENHQIMLIMDLTWSVHCPWDFEKWMVTVPVCQVGSYSTEITNQPPPSTRTSQPPTPTATAAICNNSSSCWCWIRKVNDG